MSDLSKLPKVSDTFLEHIKERPLQKSEWMPCPQCGSKEVTKPIGAVGGGVSGCALVGCWIPVVLVLTVIFSVVWLPIGIAVLVLGLLVIPLFLLVGTAFGLAYQCKTCRYSWTFGDVQTYQEKMTNS